MHSAKFQIRPYDQQLIDYVLSKIKEERVTITKQIKLKEGLDIYIDNATFAVKISKKFKSRFKGESKITKSLIGENKTKGKRIYRVTVLLRLPKDL
tara:strand:+ start:368 stop:655 length:288 start_codon:yes stop_codon:yes gene_type:complete